MSVGANIKKRRLELKLSQQELADAMGYKTRSTIAKIEAGENDVSESKLRKFSAVLQTTVAALIAEELDAPQTMTRVLPQSGGNKNVAVILAGGKSGRNRQNLPSQFINVHGKPIIVYCMEVYQAHPAIDDIYIVCLKGWESIVTAYAKQYGITKLRGIIPGGNSGIASLKNAVDHIRSRYSMEDLLFIQESTRPMVGVETISQLLLACMERGSATICHPMNEYVQFCVRDGRADYVDRNAIIALQSPEAHRLKLVAEVFDQATVQQLMQESCFTMLMYRLGHEINFIESNINNIKISREEDIAAFSMMAGRG